MHGSDLQSAQNADLVRQALVGQGTLTFTYFGVEQTTFRTVRPSKFADSTKFWAFCTLREEFRPFRLDRCENMMLNLPAAEAAEQVTDTSPTADFDPLKRLAELNASLSLTPDGRVQITIAQATIVVDDMVDFVQLTSLLSA